MELQEKSPVKRVTIVPVLPSPEQEEVRPKTREETSRPTQPTTTRDTARNDSSTINPSTRDTARNDSPTINPSTRDTTRNDSSTINPSTRDTARNDSSTINQAGPSRAQPETEKQNKKAVEILQDSMTIGRQSYLRRLFVKHSESKQQTNASNQENSRYRIVYRISKIIQNNMFRNYQNIIIADNNRFKNESIAIRMKTGLSGYSQWMNELQVYLLPDFRHRNILDSFGDDKDVFSMLPPHKQVLQRLNTGPSQPWFAPKPMRVEYWLLNNFYECIPLRDYLRMYSMSWRQMIEIAKGIMTGVNYLHEYTQYQKSINTSKVTDGFVRSTKGAVRKISFREQNSVIYLKPHFNLSIIHRNLTSMSIVLRIPSLTPCIWDFAHSHVYHPFQPMNSKVYTNNQTKDLFLASQYSAPEVLKEMGQLTLVAMKSIDMYACGMIFWELISRCVLPPLLDGDPDENRQRRFPNQYREPFQEEFGDDACPEMLRYAVCNMKTRPAIRDSWLIGQKSSRFVQTLQDLWDQDFDARIHSYTVLDRLELLDLTNRDIRNRHPHKKSTVFNKDTMWPAEQRSTQAPPYPQNCGANKTFDATSVSEEPANQNNTDGQTATTTFVKTTQESNVSNIRPILRTSAVTP